MVTSFDAWWKYGSSVAVGLLEGKAKSSRIAIDHIFWVMRPPWVKEVRMRKSIKNDLNFSNNPGAFLSESLARSDPRLSRISPTRDDDRLQLSDA